MKKQITEENFFEITNEITNKSHKATDEIVDIFEQMWKDKDNNDLSHHVWGSLALDLFLSHRVDLAITAALEAIKIGKKLDQDERSGFGAIYGDLSMFYESEKDYAKATEAMIEYLKIRESISGKDHILTKMAAEDVERLKHFQTFKKDKKLQKEFHDWVDKNSKESN